MSKKPKNTQKVIFSAFLMLFSLFSAKVLRQSSCASPGIYALRGAARLPQALT
jgi:hypothetical protein